MKLENIEVYKRDLYRCVGCGVCRAKGDDICPMWIASPGFESYTPRGVVTLALDLYEGRINLSPSISDAIYLCTTCMSCVERCGALDVNKEPLIRIPDIAIAVRNELIERGIVPDKVSSFLRNIEEYGNPWGESPDKRMKWIWDLGVEYFDPSKHEYLLYVGCVASYDERAKNMGEALVSILNNVRIKFGVLGENELCSGNEVWSMGERGLFEYLAEENIKKFKELNVKKIITLSPHAYNAFKNLYPRNGFKLSDIEIFHYTQFLHNLIESGEINFVRELDYTVTYHDPCYLGRYNGIYDIPREIIKNIPGIKLKEMRRSRKKSFCCGGGSGNFYTDMLEQDIHPSIVRVKEAMELGVDKIIVACPICLIMLSSGVVSLGVEDKISVNDISELVSKALG